MAMENALGNALVKANHLNYLLARAAKEECTKDSHGVMHCKPKESFFHKVGRWILTGCLLFFGLICLLIICCCIKRRRSKAKAANNAYPTQAYEDPPPPPPPPPPVDSKPGQVTGTTGTPHNPQSGAAASYYNGNYH